MGSKRLATFCLTCCVAFSSANFLCAQDAQFQSQFQPRNTTVKPAAYQEPPLPPWLQAVDEKKTLRQRADALIAEQEAVDQFTNQLNEPQRQTVLPRPNRMRSVGFRHVQNQQNNSFGQAPEAPKPFGPFDGATQEPSKVDPFADPPKQEGGQAPVQNSNPVAKQDETAPRQTPQQTQPRQTLPREPQTPTVQTPTQLPKAQKRSVNPQDQLTDPFADPPKRNQDSQSGNTNPLPDMPGTVQDEGNGQENLTDPFKDPPTPDNGVEYYQGTPYQERYIPPAGVYRPPVVKPDYGTAPNVAPAYPPIYQPPYQPIPGPAPAYPMAPQVYAAPAIQAPMMVAPGVQPQIVAAPPVLPSNDVYAPVVPSAGCDACGNDCANSCLGCASACPNFYFSAYVGSSVLRDMESHTGLGHFETDSGTGFGFALGRRNGRNLRTELELSFRNNDVTGFDDGTAIQPLVGEFTSYTGMVNGYWELVDFPKRCLKPYIGGGVGFISIDSEIQDMASQSILAPGSDNDTSFAFQFMAGVNYKAYRNVDLFVEYRQLKADSMRIDTVIGNSDRYDFHTDNIFAGLRWKF